METSNGCLTVEGRLGAVSGGEKAAKRAATWSGGRNSAAAPRACSCSGVKDTRLWPEAIDAEEGIGDETDGLRSSEWEDADGGAGVGISGDETGGTELARRLDWERVTLVSEFLAIGAGSEALLGGAPPGTSDIFT